MHKSGPVRTVWDLSYPLSHHRKVSRTLTLVRSRRQYDRKDRNAGRLGRLKPSEVLNCNGKVSSIESFSNLSCQDLLNKRVQEQGPTPISRLAWCLILDEFARNPPLIFVCSFLALPGLKGYSDRSTIDNAPGACHRRRFQALGLLRFNSAASISVVFPTILKALRISTLQIKAKVQASARW